jgi:uncharacterized protein YpmB
LFDRQGAKKKANFNIDTIIIIIIIAVITTIITVIIVIIIIICSKSTTTSEETPTPSIDLWSRSMVGLARKKKFIGTGTTKATKCCRSKANGVA